jgi:hypothetical protein
MEDEVSRLGLDIPIDDRERGQVERGVRKDQRPDPTRDRQDRSEHEPDDRGCWTPGARWSWERGRAAAPTRVATSRGRPLPGLLCRYPEVISAATGTNWEGVGVKPNLLVKADEAFIVAHRAALRRQREQP